MRIRGTDTLIETLEAQRDIIRRQADLIDRLYLDLCQYVNDVGEIDIDGISCVSKDTQKLQEAGTLL